MKKQPIGAKIENIRHSLAHLLAAAVLEKFPKAKLGIGPVIENGFYYDILFPQSIHEDDLKNFESRMRQLASQNLDFIGEKITIQKARKLFSDQPFKLDLIKEFVKQRKLLTIYRTGDFFDLCRGGHVKNTSEIDPSSFVLTKLAGAYWRGDEKNPQLTRIYGIAFASKKEREEYQKFQEEIEKRDHRMLGEKLNLFSQHDIAPGAIFWHPKGMILWRVLEQFIRSKLDVAGYGEVSTPVMVKKDVFVTSGHWDHYREHMFTLKVDKETYVLKPMNCPESTYIYRSSLRSYRDLPLRFSENTDRLHRNELSGTLGGLFRVRQLTQDDAHIYCRQDQIENEIQQLIDLVQEVYKVFDLKPSFKLATRPNNAMGDPKLWKAAERSLEKILKASGWPFELKEKDGAFYGPKIDIYVKDSIGREWQVSTIQLDFQMPRRFGLSYTDENGNKITPVMIHRAIFGTFERFLGILIEHYAGAFPFWLAPVQIALLPLNDTLNHYVMEVAHELTRNGHRVQVDDRNETIGRKIRDAELQKIPYLLVVGPREMQSMTIAVRERGKGDRGQMKLEKFLNEIASQRM